MSKQSVAVFLSGAFNIALTASGFLSNAYVAGAAWALTAALALWWLVKHLREKHPGWNVPRVVVLSLLSAAVSVGVLLGAGTAAGVLYPMLKSERGQVSIQERELGMLRDERNKPPDLTKWHNPKMETVAGQRFINTDVELDGKRFVDCVFNNVTFNFRGLGPFEFAGNNLFAQSFRVNYYSVGVAEAVRFDDYMDTVGDVVLGGALNDKGVLQVEYRRRNAPSSKQ